MFFIAFKKGVDCKPDSVAGKPAGGHFSYGSGYPESLAAYPGEGWAILAVISDSSLFGLASDGVCQAT